MGRSERVRAVSAGLMATGAFGVSAAVLVWGGAGERMVKAPVGVEDEWVLDGTGEYLNLADGRRITGARVRTERSITGVSSLSTSRTAVWDSLTETVDARRRTVLSTGTWRLAFDRRTAELSNCCGAFVAKDTGVPQTGLGYLWPLDGARAATYQVFDTVTGRTWGAGFAGEATLSGMRTFKYIQRIPSTTVGELKGVSGSFLGLKKGAKYDVERAYAAVITVWVDPRTGIPVDRAEETTVTLRAQGAEPVVLSHFDVRLTGDDRRTALRRAEDQAAHVRLVRVVGPASAAGAGAVLAVAGAVLARAARRVRRRSA
ncbi:DUF3068 domain-containing protein [Actinocorallia aurea]